MLPIILGPTASGKTALAVRVAFEIGAEIISADSRQVYRGMSIGTGKDLSEYSIKEVQIPYHLIDIVDAGYTYNLFEYTQDFNRVYSDILHRNTQAIVCGGTGLYLEAVIKNYNLLQVPEDAEFRAVCETRSFEDLACEFQSYKTPHNVSDFDTKKRLIRALEIARFEQQHAAKNTNFSQGFAPLVIGVSISRETRRNRIRSRLHARIQEGLLNEVETLLASGLSHEILQYYGLEYKYASLYILGNITKEQFVNDLCTAIFQFAKRQMTWFRGMERRGIHVNWIDGESEMDERVQNVLACITKYQENS